MTPPPPETALTGDRGQRRSPSRAGDFAGAGDAYRAETGRHRRATDPDVAARHRDHNTRPRRSVPSRGAGRRRAAEDNPWAVAADAAQAARRAAVDLSRRALPVSAPIAGARALSIVVRAEPDGDRLTRPLTGSHRAPGTLPIESWLLIGRYRQQALLAALVAVGILLIAIPVQQRDSGVDTAAADRAVSAAQNGGASTAPRTTAPTGSAKTRPRPTTAAPAPAPSTDPSTEENPL